jgi:hypothetical protein
MEIRNKLKTLLQQEIEIELSKESKNKPIKYTILKDELVSLVW